MDVLSAAAVSMPGVALASSYARAQLKGLPRLPKHARTETKMDAGLPTCLGALSCTLAHGSGVAKALTYEEALNQTIGGDAAPDIAENLTGFLSFLSENPLIIGGVVLVIAVPLIVSNILGSGKSYGTISAKSGYEKLVNQGDVQLLDIREGKDLRDVGSPDVQGIGKKAVAVVYRGDDNSGFLKKIAQRFKDPENTTLLVLDKYDGNSELVAKLLTANGFKAAFAIKDGAEGPQGWTNSGLPWAAPKKALTFNFTELQDAISSALGVNSGGLPLTLGLTAATGLGLLAYTEIETILQLLGSVAIIQFVAWKFLFAEDRSATIKQLSELLSTKVAPKELANEVKALDQSLVPSISGENAQPAPTEQTSAASISTTTQVKADPPVQINSVAAVEVKTELLGGRSRPLSPYPNYQDFKPPSSPSPSAP